MFRAEKDPFNAPLSLLIYTSLIENVIFFHDEGTQAMAAVMSRDRPHLSFGLSLVSSEQTFDYPKQTWRFQSQFALRDYTGVYFIKLIPCTVDEVIILEIFT